MTTAGGIWFWLRELLCAVFGLGCAKKDFVVRLGFFNPLHRYQFIWLKEIPMSATLNIDLNTDTGGHVATLVALNLDGTPANGVTVTYQSDNPASCDVDPTSGALTVGTTIGTANITGTGTRGKFSHSDSGAVNVTQDVNSGDFGVSLGLA